MLMKYNHTRFSILILLDAIGVSGPILVRGAGLNWPANQLLPTFSTPAPVLDCIDITSVRNAEADLFTSLEGIVNRTRPQIACVDGHEGEGKVTWLDLHKLSYSMVN